MERAGFCFPRGERILTRRGSGQQGPAPRDSEHFPPRRRPGLTEEGEPSCWGWRAPPLAWPGRLPRGPRTPPPPTSLLVVIRHPAKARMPPRLPGPGAARSCCPGTWCYQIVPRGIAQQRPVTSETPLTSLETRRLFPPKSDGRKPRFKEGREGGEYATSK